MKRYVVANSAISYYTLAKIEFWYSKFAQFEK